MTSAVMGATLLGLSLVVLLVGLALAIWLFVRPRQHPSQAEVILSERFARGEISSDEYRERLSTLAATSPQQRSHVAPLTAAMIAVGLAGTVAGGAWAANSSWDWMDDMMDGDMSSMMSMMQSRPTERMGDPPERGGTTTTVVSREFSFSPAEISLRQGERVNIELENEGHMFHTFTAPELDLDLRAQSGDSVAAALTPRDRGTYEFICTVPQHAEMGMRGRIVVASE